MSYDNLFTNKLFTGDMNQKFWLNFQTAQKLSLLEDVEKYYNKIYIVSKKKKAEIFKNKCVVFNLETDLLVFVQPNFMKRVL